MTICFACLLYDVLSLFPSSLQTCPSALPVYCLSLISLISRSFLSTYMPFPLLFPHLLSSFPCQIFIEPIFSPGCALNNPRGRSPSFLESKRNLLLCSHKRYFSILPLADIITWLMASQSFVNITAEYFRPCFKRPHGVQYCT